MNLSELENEQTLELNKVLNLLNQISISPERCPNDECDVPFNSLQCKLRFFSGNCPRSSLKKYRQFEMSTGLSETHHKEEIILQPRRLPEEQVVLTPVEVPLIR
ncbi:MAG: hypothetical protein MJ054_00440 [Clostridia bacterium]|nr:hypothetical protein [Clostridia bacterium]